MIDLGEADLKLVRAILQAHVPGVEVRVYGSRVRGKALRYSDLDLSIRVDIADWSAISPEFCAVIDRQYEVLVTAESSGV